MHKLRTIIIAAVTMLSLISPLALSSAVVAAPVDDACEGLKLANPAATCDEVAAESAAGGVIQNVINIMSVVVGAVSVVMIIIGGFRYVLSSGDSSSMSGAKNTILYAIVGLVIVLFAQVIVQFVLTNAQ